MSLWTIPLVAIATFAVAALLARPLIGALRRASARQIAYEDAPKSHSLKSGTPTMGGVLFAVAPLTTLLLVHTRTCVALAVLMLGCMAIGSIDDVAAIKKQKNRGLRALPKFALTALAAIAFLAVLQAGAPAQPVPVLGVGEVPWWAFDLLSICVVLATTHAVNLTDGLDGLASGTIVPPLLVLIVLAGGLLSASVFAATVLGVVLAFLLYNRYPAAVFMGDTGSLALGGALAGITIVTGAHLLLLLIGGVFVAETLSVIIQVASFKSTGRRVFRMSPLHHHFELGGWPETKVTTRFWAASLVLSALGLAIVMRA